MVSKFIQNEVHWNEGCSATLISRRSTDATKNNRDHSKMVKEENDPKMKWDLQTCWKSKNMVITLKSKRYCSVSKDLFWIDNLLKHLFL